MVESYRINKKGYHPFLISDGWQVAKLNYMKEQHITNIEKIEVHFQTDEVFLLLKGRAVLILVKIMNDVPVFELELMKSNVIYNIPKNTWHNIAMEERSEVLIVEKPNTHLEDVEYQYLNENKKNELRIKVEQIL